MGLTESVGRWRVLGHPLFTGAVAVLAVNDVVLKPRWPGWWTGKLSDVAGVVVVTVLLAVVTGNVPRSGAVTAVGFAALKVVPGVAEAAAPLLGGVTRRDVTDLAALVALVPTVRVLATLLEGHGGGRPEEAGAAGRLRRGAGLLQALVAGSGGVVAVLAISGTSCLDSPEVTGLVVRDGSVWAEGTGLVPYGEGVAGSTSSSDTLGTTPDGELEQQPADWARSDDGGRTWVASDPPPPSSSSGTDPGASADAVGTTACSTRQGCFRVADRRREVQFRAHDGEAWTTSFAFTAEQRRRLSARDEPCGARSTEVAFGDVAVVPRPDGDHVVVGAGPQGILHRPPAGEWDRRPVLESTPAPLHGPSQLRYLEAVPLLLVVVALVLVVVGPMRRWPASAIVATRFALVGAVAVGVVGVVVLPSTIDYTVTGPLVATLSLAVFAASVLIARRGRAPS